jgi:plasmid stabilization system protein ParE
VKRIALRPRADADLIEIAQWYERQGGPALAGRFFDDARASAERIAATPRVGSPRFGQILGMTGLRS